MNVEIFDSSLSVKDLDEGDLFTYQYEVYMRIRSVAVRHEEKNVVRLTGLGAGCLSYLPESVVIKKVTKLHAYT